jgi:hypothetical protein
MTKHIDFVRILYLAFRLLHAGLNLQLYSESLARNALVLPRLICVRTGTRKFNLCMTTTSTPA